MAPSNARAGVYELQTELIADGSPLRAVLHEVIVGRQRELKVTVLSAPRFVLEENAQVTFAVRNGGNVTESVLISAEASQGASVTIESPTSLSLEPGGLAEVLVELAPPTRLEAPRRIFVSLSATGQQDERAAATATAAIEAIAIRQPKALAYRVLEGEVGVSLRARSGANGGATSIDDEAGLSLQLQAAGPLLADDDELKISLSAGIGDGRQENLLSYRNRNAYLRFGHQEVRATPLLPTVTGFGAAISTPGGEAEESRERVFALVGDDFAAGVSVREKVTEELVLMFETRLMPESALLVAGADMTLRTGDDSNLSVTAQQGADMRSRAVGFAVDFDADSPVYGLDAEWSHTTVGYAGNASRSSYAADLRVRDRAGGTTELTAGYRAIDEGSAPVYRGASLAVQANEAHSGMSLRYLSVRSIDKTGSSQRRDLRFSSSLDLSDGIALSPRVWWERKVDLDTGTVEKEAGSELELALPLLGGIFTPAVGVEYGLQEGKLEAIDLKLGWQGELTAVSDLRVYGSIGVWGEGGGEIWVDGKHEFEGGTTVSLRAVALAGNEEPDRFEAELAFGVPFELPLARRSDVGELHGSVKDSRGQGIAGAVVWLAGYTDQTGADGSFSFPAVPTGRHAISLQGIAPGFVVTPALPHTIEMGAGDSQDLVLNVFEAADISARITLAQAGAGGANPSAVVGPGEAVDEEVLLSGVVLSLEGPRGNQQAALSPDGTAHFTHLPPGEWTLSVAEASVPEYHRVTPASQTIQLKEGTSATVSFELVPVVRRIQFQDGGVVGD